MIFIYINSEINFKDFQKNFIEKSHILTLTGALWSTSEILVKQPCKQLFEKPKIKTSLQEALATMPFNHVVVCFVMILF